MSTDQLRQFFAHISRDPSLREQVLQAVSADAAALIAQELGYEVSGDELLRFSGKSSWRQRHQDSAPRGISLRALEDGVRICRDP